MKEEVKKILQQREYSWFHIGKNMFCATLFIGLSEYQGVPAYYKYLKTQVKYDREKEAYYRLAFCDYVPRLLFSDDKEKLLVISSIGTSLKKKYKAKERKKFIPMIAWLNARLINEYGIYHNDIRWKNVCETESGLLYLIDFGQWTDKQTGSREADAEKILEQARKYV